MSVESFVAMKEEEKGIPKTTKPMYLLIANFDLIKLSIIGYPGYPAS